MRYLLAILLAGGLIYAFYYGLYETGVLQDTGTPKGYYAKNVDSEIKLQFMDDGSMRLIGYHLNTGDRDLRDIQVHVMLPNSRGDVREADTIRLGVLRAQQRADIDSTLDVSEEEFPSPSSGRFRYKITAKFDDEDLEDFED